MNLVFELTQVWVCITTKMAHMACYHCFVLCFLCPVAHGLDGPVALCQALTYKSMVFPLNGGQALESLQAPQVVEEVHMGPERPAGSNSCRRRQNDQTGCRV